MIGFGLLVGHMLGDYVLQNDWQATWKASPAGQTTPEEDAWVMSQYGDCRMAAIGVMEAKAAWRPFLACSAHCLLYTLAVWACSFWWMPWWGLAVCFLAHWPVDRFRLARWWMMNVSGQTAFATGALAPWSVIVVDNTFHLLTLFLVALAA